MRFAPPLFALFACAAASGCSDASHASSPKAAAAIPTTHVDDLPTQADIAALFDIWNAHLRTGSAEEIAALYAEDGVLLPTVSNTVREGRAAIGDYFEHFLTLRPLGVINERHIVVLDRNTAVNSGVYTFDIVRDGRADYVAARYSFVYEKRGKDWLIVSHHSSAMPHPLDERPPALADAPKAIPAPAH